MTPIRETDSKRRLLSPVSVALDNLRAVTILLLIGFHSAIAYVAFGPPAATDFALPPFSWQAFPISDSRSFFGFDLLCAWQDVYLMSLMFLLSGLFVWPSLARKKAWRYLRDRVLRLGLPFAIGIVVLMPLAYYPAYRVLAPDAGFAIYWRSLSALPFWPTGPLWFIWLLLAFDVVALCLHLAAPRAMPALGRWSARAGRFPVRYVGVLLAVSAAAYVPLAVAYTPWAWTSTGYFGIQLSRPLHYAVYFFAGAAIGAGGIEGGLLAVDGVLARRWPVLLGAALLSVFLWMGLTGLTMDGDSSLGMQVVADLAFVPACAAGCLLLIGLCLRFASAYSPWLGGLSANAYGIYLVHYVFIVWLQYFLLSAPLWSVVKAIIVFGGTLLGSLAIAVSVQRIPLAARLIGATPRAAVAS